MLIETKFNVGDQRWMMRHNKPTIITIVRMDLEVDKNNQVDTYYYINSNEYPVMYLEQDMIKRSFPTKQELINSL